MNTIAPSTERRTSEILSEIITRCDQPGEISVSEFAAMLGDRAFALAILIFALPNSLPIPGIPGVSTVTGLPITFFAAQMMMGRETMWLPPGIGKKTFARASLAKLLKKCLPAIIKLERYLKPRWAFMSSNLGERMLGAMCVVLSLIMALPIIGGNFLPGFSISLLALSLLEKDGRLAALAFAFSIGSIVIMYKIIKFAAIATIDWVSGFF